MPGIELSTQQSSRTMRFLHLQQQNRSSKVHSEGEDSRTWMALLRVLQCGGIQQLWVRAWEHLQRDFHSDLKEGKGEEEEVALMEVGRQCGAEETRRGRGRKKRLSR